MVACSVIGCGMRKSRNQASLTMHRFPTNASKKKMWLDAIGIENIKTNIKCMHICSLHFHEECFNKTLNVIRLRDDAVPSKFVRVPLKVVNTSTHTDPHAVSDSSGIATCTSDSDGDDDVWDDRKLNDAYDKALRIANAEVAKRVAMSTNTQHHSKDVKSKKEKPSSKAAPSTQSKKKENHWKAGMPCRAVYEGDGLEYEAFVLRLINDKECVVRFLGYENSEIVALNTLKPTLGNEERTRQIEQAMNEKEDDGFASQSPNGEGMDYSDRAHSPESYNALDKKNKSSKKKKNKKQTLPHGFQLPNMPLPMPNLSMLRNMGSMEMPMPPPPVAFSRDSDAEDQAISSMLLSWYMSGYYTGLYQGMKRAK